MGSTDVDFTAHFSLQVASLKLFRMWFFIPHSRKSLNFWYAAFAKTILGIFVFVIPTCVQFVYLIRLIISGEAEIQEIAGIINLILTELLASCRLFDLYLRRDLFQKLMDQLLSEEFARYKKTRTTMLRNAIQLSRWLYCGLLLSISCDIIVHVIVVPGLYKFKTLPLKMDFIFFDVNDRRFFMFVYMYQIFYKPFMTVSFAVMQTLPWAAMSFTISQLDVLIYNLENMKEFVKAIAVEKRCDGNEAFKKAFRECVFHHSCIMRFVETMQLTFGGQLTSMLFISACVVCTTAVQILSIDSPSENMTTVGWIILYISLFIFILFIDCYFGDTVTVKCAYLPTAVFSIPWLEQPKNIQMNTLLFIMKTQQPVHLIAAKLVPVSLTTFTQVMNWTYKGFALMNQMK